jgi:hypothetical protein
MSEKQNDILTFSFSPSQMQVIDAALQSLPFRTAAPLINEINRQISQQLPAASKLAAPNPPDNGEPGNDDPKQERIQLRDTTQPIVEVEHP